MLNAVPGRKRIVLSLALLLVAGAPVRAALPNDAAKKSAAVGQPASLLAQPPSVTLVGPRAMEQVVITGRYADGTVRDLTPFCEWSVDSGDIISVTPSG